MKNRVYHDDFLKNKSKIELGELKDKVMTNPDLTKKEQDLNIEKIELFENGGINTARNRAIAKDIIDSATDIGDLG